MKRLFYILRKTAADDSGFTLLELLVATAIASIILLMAGRSYDAVLKTINDMTGYAEFYENVGLTISRMDRDISGAYINQINKNVAFICDTSEKITRLSFITTDHRDMNIAGQINKPYPSTDINAVSYYLREDMKYPGLYFLIRRDKLHYDNDPETGGREHVLLKNVMELKFEFKMNNDWVARWDSRTNKLYPREVKTSIKIKNFSGKEESFVFYSIPVMAQ